MARATKKRRNFLGLGKKETYHARIVRAGGTKPRSIRRALRYQGVRIIPAGRGEYTTSIDRDSRFDDLVTAKAFVKSWQKKNPKSKSRRANAKRLKLSRKPRRALTTKSKAPKKSFTRNSGYWSAKQGKAEARVYQTPSKSTGRDYVIEVMSPSGFEELRARNFDQAKAIARRKLHEFASNPNDPSIVPFADYANTIGKAGKRVAKGLKQSTSKLLKKIGRKKNPVDIAVQRYEEFHGNSVNEILELESREHRHSVTYGIGQLICLNVIGVDGKEQFPIVSPGFKYVGGPQKDILLQFDRGGRLSFDKGGRLLSPDQAGAEGFWKFNPKTPAEKIVWLTAGEDNKQLLLSGGDQSLDLKALGFTDRDYHDHMLIGNIVRVWYRTRKKFEGDEEVDFFHNFGAEGSKGIMPVLNYRPKNPSLEIAGGRYEIALPDKSLGGISPGVVG